MSIEPCTEGKHSTTDLPPQIEKKEVAPEDAPYSTTSLPPPPPRAPVAAPAAAPQPPPPPEESSDDDASLEIPDGNTCRRKGCGVTYSRAKGRGGTETCTHHPGAPLFHEGSKGYTCCKRRVLEFDQFLKIEGCETKTRHLFVGSGGKRKRGDGRNGAAEGAGEELLETVRHDFYQTATTVIASFFLKKIDKDTAKVEFTSQSLRLDLPTTDAPTPRRYRAEVPLFGPIDVAKSTFKILGTKLEVCLAKADASSWPVLRSGDRLTGEILQVGRAGRV